VFLEGFFECQACDTFPANMLGIDVKDMRELTYLHHNIITVHLDDVDSALKRREKMYATSTWPEI
jgi:hypothetical protein